MCDVILSSTGMVHQTCISTGTNINGSAWRTSGQVCWLCCRKKQLTEFSLLSSGKVFGNSSIGERYCIPVAFY